MGANTNHLDTATDQNGFDYENLIEEIKTYFLSGLESLLEGMFNNSDDAFFELAEKADNDQLHQVYSRIMSAVRLQRTSIKSTFNAVLAESFKAAAEKNDNLPNGNSDGHEFALDDVGESAAIVDMRTRAMKMYHERLLHLGERIEFISQHSTAVFPLEAILPITLWHAYIKAIKPVCTGMDLQNKLILYKLFDKMLIGNLGGIYDTINNALIEADLMPKMKTGQATSPHRPATNASGDEFAPEQSTDTAATPATQLSADQYHSKKTVLSGLSLLQMSHTRSGIFSANELKDALSEKIGELHEPAANLAFSQSDSKIIDMILLLFNSIIKNNSLSEVVKSLLLRLQIPVIKCAMQDREFFTDPDHPLRNFMNSLARSNMSFSRPDDPLISRLESIFDELLDNFDQRAVSYQTALDNLNALIQEQGSVKNEPEAATNTADFKQYVRVTVLKELKKQIGGNIFPKIAHNLVLKHWSTVMYSQYIKHGKDSAQWFESIELLKEIMSLLQLDDSAESADNMAAKFSLLTQKLAAELAKFKVNRDDALGSLNELRSGYNLMLEDKRSSEKAQMNASPLVADQNTHGPDPVDDYPELEIAYPADDPVELAHDEMTDAECVTDEIDDADAAAPDDLIQSADDYPELIIDYPDDNDLPVTTTEPDPGAESATDSASGRAPGQIDIPIDSTPTPADDPLELAHDKTTDAECMTDEFDDAAAADNLIQPVDDYPELTIDYPADNDLPATATEPDPGAESATDSASDQAPGQTDIPVDSTPTPADDPGEIAHDETTDAECMTDEFDDADTAPPDDPIQPIDDFPKLTIDHPDDNNLPAAPTEPDISEDCATDTGTSEVSARTATPVDSTSTSADAPVALVHDEACGAACATDEFDDGDAAALDDLMQLVDANPEPAFDDPDDNDCSTALTEFDLSEEEGATDIGIPEASAQTDKQFDSAPMSADEPVALAHDETTSAEPTTDELDDADAAQPDDLTVLVDANPEPAIDDPADNDYSTALREFDLSEESATQNVPASAEPPLEPVCDETGDAESATDLVDDAYAAESVDLIQIVDVDPEPAIDDPDDNALPASSTEFDLREKNATDSAPTSADDQVERAYDETGDAECVTDLFDDAYAATPDDLTQIVDVDPEPAIDDPDDNVFPVSPTESDLGEESATDSAPTPTDDPVENACDETSDAESATDVLEGAYAAASVELIELVDVSPERDIDDPADNVFPASPTEFDLGGESTTDSAAETEPGQAGPVQELVENNSPFEPVDADNNHPAETVELPIRTEDTVPNETVSLSIVNSPATGDSVVELGLSDTASDKTDLPETLKTPMEILIKSTLPRLDISDSPAVEIDPVETEPAKSAKLQSVAIDSHLHTAGSKTIDETSAGDGLEQAEKSSAIENANTPDTKTLSTPEPDSDDQTIFPGNLPDGLKSGAWFSLYAGSRKQEKRAILSAVIHETYTLIFVDHDGSKITNKQLQDFIHELDKGTSSIVVEDFAFDESLGSVISSLRNR